MKSLVKVLEVLRELLHHFELRVRHDGVDRVLVRELRVEVGHVELVLRDVGHEGRLELAVLELLEVDVLEPLVLLDLLDAVHGAEARCRVLVEQLGEAERARTVPG